MTTSLTTTVASSRAELLRLRKWPAFWVLLGTWIALNISFAYVFNYLAYRNGDAGENGLPPEALLRQLLPAAVPEVFVQGMAMFGGALLMILGALATGSGFGWGTWKTVFTQRPSRTAAVTGVVVTLTGVVVGVVLTAFVVDLAVACTIAVVEAQPIELPTASASMVGIASGIAILEMWTLAGVFIGIIARGPALAVGLGLVWVLVVENLLRGVATILGPLRVVTDYLPGTAAGSLAGAARTLPGDPVPGVLDVLTRSQSVVTLLVYLVLFVVGTVLLVRYRDV